MSEETTTGGSGATAMRVAEATPAHRYTAELAGEIERRWQARWAADGTFQTPNPAGPLGDPAAVAGRRKFFLLDMFPYPSGNGLHVGHPLGYIGTDVLGRFQRMNGYNVLHALGFDAFGLPAEQYAVQTGQHPRTTTERNIEIFRRQLSQLGLAHDPRRSVSTMEPEHYRWTQWIFLRIHDSWYDPDAALGRGRARPISELIDEFASGARALPDGRLWMDLSPTQRAEVIDGHRLAYPADAPVNWCPGLGTVLSNEEVTSDGRSERGNFPVFRRNLRQWMMRITAYADRLLDDLDRLDWPESIKLMQRNWIGRSLGCRVRFATAGAPIEVFTTRPDTLFGVTFLAVAPEHPMLASLTAPVWPADVDQFWTGGALTPAEAVAAYQRQAATKSDMDRQETKVKTGVFTGSYAVNPVNGAKVPIFVADYVLMGYGTGAVMAVPGQDQRDREFATAFRLPVIRTVAVPEGFEGDVYTGDGVVVNSANDQGLDLNGLATEQAKKAVVSWLEAGGHGSGAVQYKLRDWLFSRQRYWGEPFPIVYDADGVAHGLPESMLPVELPEVDDYTPATFDPEDADSQPCPPLSRAQDWVNVELDLGDGVRTYRREVNTMPNWAGSCWYYLRYLDPTNNDTFCDPEVERYWMSAEIGEHGPADPGGVDLYVGGQEHAVLHLLYARFWHKVLHDLGEVSSEEPFRRLFNQGMIEAYAYTDERGSYVDAGEVVEDNGRYLHDGVEVKRIYGKMGKSLRNVVTPDEMCDDYGADTFRLYEMSMGPLDASRPWSTKDVVGAQRFLQRLWRNLIDETTGELRLTEAELPEDVLKALHKTIAGTRDDYQGLRFNTAAAKLIELNNLLTKTYGNTPGTPRAVAEPLVLMLAPLCPHLAEELWSRLGHTDTVAYQSYPVADERYLVEDMIEYPIQVNGRVRTKIMVPVGAERLGIQDAALADEKIVAALEGRTPRKVIVVLGRLVNIVV